MEIKTPKLSSKLRKKAVFNNEKIFNELDMIIRLNTKMKSPEVIHKFLVYYSNVCDYLQLDYSKYIEYSNVIITPDQYKELILSNGKDNITYINWLKHICNFIFKCKVPDELPKKIEIDYKFKPEIKNPYHYMTKEELEELWRVADDIDRGLMVILLTTGMRVGALAQLTKDKINNKGIIELIEKGNKGKRYKITKQAMEYINNNKFFLKTKNKDNITRRIKDIAKRSNLKKIDHIHPHTFRHTFAKILVEKGMKIETISLMLNHSNINTTKNVYLQETSMDVIDRGEIPWFEKSDTTIVPDFLVFV